MAFTGAVTGKTVFGDKRVHFMKVTADAATGSVDTGLDIVDHISASPKSLTTGAIKLVINELPVGTSSAGTIAVTGMTSGDEFYLTVYGR